MKSFALLAAVFESFISQRRQGSKVEACVVDVSAWFQATFSDKNVLLDGQTVEERGPLGWPLKSLPTHFTRYLHTWAREAADA